MDFNVVLFLVLVADIAIIVAIIFLILKMKAAAKTKDRGRYEVEELRSIIGESQKAAGCFLENMDLIANRLAESLRLLEEKESNLAGLLIRINEARLASQGTDQGKVNHNQIIRMVKDGVPLAEIRRASGLSEAEITLIIDLHRAKSPNAGQQSAID